MSARRIVVAGYWHESSGDAARLDGPVGLEHLTVLDGAPLLAFLASAGLGAGLLEACRVRGIEVVPGTVAMGPPSATAAGDVYATVRPRILASVLAARPVDGVYLYLHGAAATTAVDDVEGDLAQAVRAIVGPEVPVVTALDLHALVTPAMAATIDVMLGCHTYPHVDLGERAAEAVGLLARMWEGLRPVTHLEPVPISLPMTATDLGPMPTLASCSRAQEAVAGVLDCTFFHGYPYTDSPLLGASVVAIAEDSALAKQAATELAAAAWAVREDLRPATLTPADAVSAALAAGRALIADSADNPGAGAPGDNTHLLHALLAARPASACLGYFTAPDAVAVATAAGVGATVDVTLGGRHPDLLGPPLSCTAEVTALTGGRYTVTNPMYAGGEVSYGPGACLRVGGVDIVCCSHPHQVLDPAGFAIADVDVAARRIVAVKSRQHFRAGFPDATTVLLADGGGLSTYRVELLPRHRRPRPLWPFDR